MMEPRNNFFAGNYGYTEQRTCGGAGLENPAIEELI
jgi:hypothetical protein